MSFFIILIVAPGAPVITLLLNWDCREECYWVCRRRAAWGCRILLVSSTDELDASQAPWGLRSSTNKVVH